MTVISNYYYDTPVDPNLDPSQSLPLSSLSLSSSSSQGAPAFPTTNPFNDTILTACTSAPGSISASALPALAPATQSNWPEQQYDASSYSSAAGYSSTQTLPSTTAESSSNGAYSMTSAQLNPPPPATTRTRSSTKPSRRPNTSGSQQNLPFQCDECDASYSRQCDLE